MSFFNTLKSQFINKHIKSIIEEHDPREHLENQTVCYAWSKVLHQIEFPELRKLKLNGKHQVSDVLCSGKVEDLRFSTNITAYLGYNNDMTWGYNGTGPHNFALNILYYFSDGDKPFAYNNAYKFINDILKKLTHRQDGRIKYEVIIAWIKAAKLEQEKKEEASHV
jgi:hypothetical protein